MDLFGWDYVGRNIDDTLHQQFRVIVDCLSDPAFVAGRNWSNRTLQIDIAKKLGITDGQVRTCKRVFEDLRLIKRGSLGRTVPTRTLFMTEVGERVYQASCLEQKLCEISDEQKRIAAHKHIKGLYEEGYAMAMAYYYFDFGGTPPKRLHPLRATLRALSRYGSLDKWEWYLLNTDIREDDNTTMETLLDKHIKAYRNGELTFSMNNIKSKPKAHQYLPQFFYYAGLVNLQNGIHWRISDNGKYKEFKSEVMSDDFLSKIYRMEQ